MILKYYKYSKKKKKRRTDIFNINMTHVPNKMHYNPT